MASIVKGFHPETGEEITIEFKGNFPLKDPDTNIFFTVEEVKKRDLPSGFYADAGKQFPVFIGRERVRYSMLNQAGQEVLDDRPVAASVAFREDVSIEQRMQMMIADAEARVERRLREAQGNFYPTDLDSEIGEDEDLEHEETVDPRYVSPHEFVNDNELGREVPRALSKIVKAEKANKEAVQKQKASRAATLQAELSQLGYAAPVPEHGASKTAEGSGTPAPDSKPPA